MKVRTMKRTVAALLGLVGMSVRMAVANGPIDACCMPAPVCCEPAPIVDCCLPVETDACCEPTADSGPSQPQPAAEAIPTPAEKPGESKAAPVKPLAESAKPAAPTEAS